MSFSQRILVIQTAFIGDVVLTTPFLRELRSRHKDAAIDLVTTPEGCELLSGLPGVRLHPLDKKKWGIREGLRRVRSSLRTAGDDQPFDLVYSVHRSLRSLWLGKSVTARERVAFQSFWSRVLGYKTVRYPPYREDIHYAEKPFALLGDQARAGELRPELVCSDQERAELRRHFPTLAGAGDYIVISPFSVWGTKMWFSDRFAQLGVELTRRNLGTIILVGGGGVIAATARPGARAVTEKAVAASLARKISEAGGKVLDLTGQTSLAQLKALIAGAKCVVANDSAPIHIAAAFNVPTVAIFGPTVKKWGFFPLASRAKVVERTSLSCRPCHIHGPHRCPKGHFRCMSEIQVEDVVEAVESILR